MRRRDDAAVAAGVVAGSASAARAASPHEADAETRIATLKTPSRVVSAKDAPMTGQARPVCPMCGAPLFARSYGDMTCVTHGHFVSAQTLDATFGAGSAQRVAQQVARASLTPRKCPDDRYEMSVIRNESGSVVADACGRCGGIWMPLAPVEHAMHATPRPDLSPSDARSLFALGCVRSVLPVVAQRAR